VRVAEIFYRPDVIPATGQVASTRL